MSPKIPRKPAASTSSGAETTTHSAARPDNSAEPFLFRNTEFNSPDTNNPFQTLQQPPSNRPPPTSAVEVTPIVTRNIVDPVEDSSIETYWLPEALLRGMQAPDETGVRHIVGRKFVDVEYEGVLHTVNVAQEPINGAYRIKRLRERDASGPLVVKNPQAPTWRLDASTPLPQKRPAPATADAPQAQRPRSATPLVYADDSAYSATLRSPDAQGYFELTPRGSLPTTASATLFAFRANDNKWIQVDPPSGGFGAKPANLAHWTDKEIFDLYRIHGADIERFRTQAQVSGMPPKWVEPVIAQTPVTDLLNNGLRWLHPQMNASQRESWLQSYNLLPSQLTRLQQHLRTELSLPHWAESHKQLTQDLAHPQRLEQLARDTATELELKRGAKHPWYSPESSMTPALRETLLKQMGYRRNKHNLLYLTDVPALFRADDRTPFEIANDDAMLPRMKHKPGATTEDRPMSATFSLNEGMMYAKAPDPEYLLYNTQTNKHPGKKPTDTDASDSSDTDSSDASDSSDDERTKAWDHERNYTAVRTRQSEMFLYLLDTRNIEVVPREENHSFNWGAQKDPAWFPEDDFEGLISVSRSGLDADRIWLLNSARTKAANVDDIRVQAGTRAERIEWATQAGHANSHEYDQLIDGVEAAGKPILKLSGSKKEFGYDIQWP